MKRFYDKKYNCDICKIECNKTEIRDALKCLDRNISQSSRITLNIDGSNLYIFNYTTIGRKSASLKDIPFYDDAMGFVVRNKNFSAFWRMQKHIEKMLIKGSNNYGI